MGSNQWKLAGQVAIWGVSCFCSGLALAEQVGCVTTEWKLVGANHRVCVESFPDPQVSGVTCHVSQARTGGVKRLLRPGAGSVAVRAGLSTDRSDHVAGKAAERREVFSDDTSILFKETRVVRMWDEANRTLVYLAISRKLIDGAPANSISTVPVMPWGGR
jgi:CreA protein